MPKNAASYLGVSIVSYTEAIFVKQNTMANAFNARNTKICYFSENIYLLNGTKGAVNFMFMFWSHSTVTKQNFRYAQGHDDSIYRYSILIL